MNDLDDIQPKRVFLILFIFFIIVGVIVCGYALFCNDLIKKADQERLDCLSELSRMKHGDLFDKETDYWNFSTS